ncbi:hypothetical protein CEXT_562601 [Caerostris extrusa]|uniref:Uncharacterized protein n=1 Tax=Caerostris extrusa TaxID=172846 RepID=A0AAV4XJH6_CAEEX|nr:hypothetical protein CEXT_562601 [Caerostris extrusa]
MTSLSMSLFCDSENFGATGLVTKREPNETVKQFDNISSCAPASESGAAINPRNGARAAFTQNLRSIWRGKHNSIPANLSINRFDPFPAEKPL